MENNNGNNRNQTYQDQAGTEERQWRNKDWNERNKDWNNRDFEENRNRNYGAGNMNQNYGSEYGNRNTSRWNDENRQDHDYGSGDNRSYGTRNFSRNNSDSGNYGNYNRNNRDGDSDRNWWDRTSDEVASWFGDDDAKRRRRMDENGPHKGKGPKGYLRSDEKIRDDINDKLYHDSYVDASNIEVTVSDGDVTLSGTVDSRETKRRAEDLTEGITGVKDVSNNLKIDRTNSISSTAYQSNDNDRKKGRFI